MLQRLNEIKANKHAHFSQLITLTNDLVKTNNNLLQNQQLLDNASTKIIFDFDNNSYLTLDIFREVDLTRARANKTNRNSLFIFIELYAQLIQQISDCYQQQNKIYNRVKADSRSKAFIEELAVGFKWYQPLEADPDPRIFVTPTSIESQNSNNQEVIAMLQTAYEALNKLSNPLDKTHRMRFIQLLAKFKVMELELCNNMLHPWEALAARVNGKNLKPTFLGRLKPRSLLKSTYECEEILEPAKHCPNLQALCYVDDNDDQALALAIETSAHAKIQYPEDKKIIASCLASTTIDAIAQRMKILLNNPNFVCTEDSLLAHKNQVIIALQQLAIALDFGPDITEEVLASFIRAPKHKNKTKKQEFKIPPKKAKQFDLWLEAQFFPLLLLPASANIAEADKLVALAVLDIYFSNRVNNSMKQDLTATEKQNITFIKRSLLLIQAFIYGQTDAVEKLITVIDRLVLKNKLEQLASKSGSTATLQSQLTTLNEELAKYHFTLPIRPEKYISVLTKLSRLLEKLPSNPSSDDLRRSRMFFQSTIHKVLLDDPDPNKSPDAAILLISMLIPHMVFDPVAKKASEYYREHPLDRGITKEQSEQVEEASRNPKKLSGNFLTPPRATLGASQKFGHPHTVARAKNLIHTSHSNSNSASKPKLTVEEWQALSNNMKQYAEASGTTSTISATKISSPSRNQQASNQLAPPPESPPNTRSSSQFTTPTRTPPTLTAHELNSTIGRYRAHPPTKAEEVSEEQMQQLLKAFSEVEKTAKYNSDATTITPGTPTSDTDFLKGQSSISQPILDPDVIDELTQAVLNFDFATHLLSNKSKNTPDTPYVWQQFKTIKEKRGTSENQENRNPPKPLAHQLNKLY